MGVSGQRHAPAALLPPGKGPPVPIVQEAGRAPEPVWTQRLEEKSFAPAGIEPRSHGRPARSQKLYWLSYPAPVFHRYEPEFNNIDIFKHRPWIQNTPTDSFRRQHVRTKGCTYHHYAFTLYALRKERVRIGTSHKVRIILRSANLFDVFTLINAVHI
jgi:hypothetical protein